MTDSVKSTESLTWLITGCSSGFGLQFVRHALATGHHVIATSRNPSRTPDLVQEVEAAGGRWLQLDTDDADSARVVTELEAAGTQIDVLVNSAGFSIAGPVEAFSEDEVRRLMETNFFGPYRLMRACVRFMRARRRGVIVNLSSGSGLQAREVLGMYGASKSALDNITKTLAKEMKPFNVRVLLVYLGSFNTAMATKVDPVQKPLDPDYQGTVLQQFYDSFDSKTFVPKGDHKKAVKAIFDVVVGEGAGAGKEKEVQMILGKDCAVRLGEVRAGFDHMMDVFGEVCNNVDVD
ncbi:hypothetical protein JX265_000459 [Neoarthrinium moseri]|uniref:Short-chain oxidoreductase n=1 Tax=Neoarthrinium moseri TaxID=1658444 RepID=A0A9P9WYJ1_9PEZI|nr:hypothetical protein JX265_000459 [Neoarthrinium moseri]